MSHASPRHGSTNGHSTESRDDIDVEVTPEQATRLTDSDSAISSNAGGHKRSLSGSILARLPFLRTTGESDQVIPENDDSLSTALPIHANDHIALSSTSPTNDNSGRIALVAAQQKKTRRRKGSLRKAALLGRGAQHHRLELNVNDQTAAVGGNQYPQKMEITPTEQKPPLGQINTDFRVDSEATPRPSIDESRRLSASSLPFGRTPSSVYPEDSLSTRTTSSSAPTATTSPTLTYTSTTDEDDLLSMPPHHTAGLRTDLSLSSEPYYAKTGVPSGTSALLRRRSNKSSQSPLSLNTLSGLTSNTLPASGDDAWDYTETEWWGWVILISTWLVFVMGMGSCFGVWSWAWDVGQTPYAPPELEDDPTLPIVGYYPALIILTAVMAWVWVVIAWVGMKYFRHAKISGD